MSMSQKMKENLNSLYADYANGNDKEKCVDRLYILIYYHYKDFGLYLNKDDISDMLSTLYPKFIENIFIKYDAKKANFYTFTSACLKYQMQGFLKANHKKECTKEIILEEIKKEEEDAIHNILDTFFYHTSYIQYYKENVASSKVAIPKGNNREAFQDKKIEEEFKEWFMINKSKKQNKKYKRLIFILICKAAPFLDYNLLDKISSYLELDIKILQYYVDLCNLEYMTNNKHIVEAKQRRDKYFMKILFNEKMLREDEISEYDSSILKTSKEYSIKKYKTACAFLSGNIKSISNRTIAKITGISRSIIDRLIPNIKDLLEDIKKIDIHIT